MQGILTWARRHLAVIAVCGTTLVGIVVAAIWWTGLQATLSVTATTGVPRCRGTELTTVRTDEGLRHTAIPMRDGFTCTVTVSVANDSDRTVTVERLLLPFGGPAARAGYEVRGLGGSFFPANDRTDAVARPRSTLDPGEATLVEVSLRFRRQGCMSKGGWMATEPQIEVTALLASRTLSVSDFPAFLGTADSSCDT